MVQKAKKLKIALVFGGKSVEHEVSLQSVRNIIDALDKTKYEIVLVGINKDGSWSLKDRNNFLLNSTNPKLIALNKNSTKSKDIENSLAIISQEEKRGKIDVVFPVLHGPYGEDGTMQGFLKLAGIPFVGPSVLGSSIGFDKDITKRLLSEAGIPNTKFISFRNGDGISFLKVKKILGLPMIVKPANAGSSVGINKISNEKEFKKAIKEAFLFDSKIIIEKFIEGKREIECAVLGNENPKASVCGEVITDSKHKFYSYEAKYIDEIGAKLEIPANISKSLQRKIQDLAIKTFKVLELEGMARVDFFIDKKGKIFVNEVNTIPGFTNISMYPALWKASGLSYTKLIDELVDLAIERFNREQKLKTSYNK
ncbi:MAG: D-alanine-D-alanine ligase [Candidatus Nomurabacteria bacterium GW2011_GWF2_35_66]|uniref:D-alanine--D-alanine ligase n=1 Tax=Candidatus Nomurabacteria bacterium GW2011_GWE1_35_16 TaxID=1618761 RepID=A0A0G0BPU5_9BACT|nr:MAG: D-alanine-D-alanine ligase [Candidatus Nomurabacteria bacterium GW2011_GWF1_34_20]KKP63176.1 MAG: D-alanine-D-alanine ligase [Candidatus Nomurabacteria bacterium GW2011_GWE2_34_25]KKP65651.1 MAG: D-alanine-D-alanine ligase [Candidatus Nomurabacteria bacterium GW2011_GWE1_35_16]KKP83262.1 MAG: D-alanine-D-alanine ligase [Candidatus Nomurabacteria bacterium GW2011_GWF2_35_66]HAE36723.1 D-alanine--D-alanine ligase [Candidatus Nomurabacteria bacterium]